MRIRFILMATVAAPLMLGTAAVSFTPALAQNMSVQDIKKARKDATKDLKQARNAVKQAEKRLQKAQKKNDGVEAAEAALADAQQNLSSAEQRLQAAMAAKPAGGAETAQQPDPVEKLLENNGSAEAAETKRAEEEKIREQRAERRRQREQEAAEAQAAEDAKSDADASEKAAEQNATDDEELRKRRAERRRQREQATEAQAAEDAKVDEKAEAAATEKAADEQLREDEQRRERRAERRKRLREQEARTGGKDDGTVEIIRESEAVGTELDDQDSRQVERLRRKLREQRRQIRDLESAETDANEDVVRRTRDGRIIIRRDDQLIIKDPGDDQRFLRHARDVIVEDLPRGRTRTTITRPDGTQIITIKNRYGDILYRVRRRPNGREIVLIDNRDYQRRPGINFNVELPRLIVPIPRNEYIVDLERADRRQLRETLIAPPIEPVERVYTLEEVRQSERLRDKVRRIDLDTVTFATGSAEISPNQVLDLAEIGYAMEEVLIENPEAVFFVEGHTDAVGSDYSNLELSDRRAESVAIVLSENFDIPPENLITQGYGEEFLKIQTEGPEQRNRRVTIRPITDLIRPS